jgi:hypothetical protein
MAPGIAVASWSGGPCYANLTLLQAAVTRQYCLQPSRSGASYCARSAGGCLPRSCAHWSEFGQARSAVKPGLQTERTRRKPHSVRGQIVLVGVVRAPGPAGPALAGSTVDGASPATLPGPDLGASFVSKLAARRYSAFQRSGKAFRIPLNNGACGIPGMVGLRMPGRGAGFGTPGLWFASVDLLPPTGTNRRAKACMPGEGRGNWPGTRTRSGGNR